MVSGLGFRAAGLKLMIWEFRFLGFRGFKLRGFAVESLAWWVVGIRSTEA